MRTDTNTETMPTRTPMRPRGDRRIEIRNGRRQDRSGYSRREA